jgi:hypothetical protein
MPRFQVLIKLKVRIFWFIGVPKMAKIHVELSGDEDWKQGPV